MKIKKYLVEDMPEAIQLIKGDLGPEAVIISSRKVRTKGLTGLLGHSKLEVTAAVDDFLSSISPALTQSPTVSSPTFKGEGRDGGVWTKGTSLFNDSKLPADGPAFWVGKELAEVKVLLQKLVSNEKGNNSQEAFYEKWRNMLLGIGIQEELVDLLVKRLYQNPDLRESHCDEMAHVLLCNQITQLLEPAYRVEVEKTETENQISRLFMNKQGKTWIPDFPNYTADGKVKVLSFIGPTGVGKTTTLAKLAAQFTLFQARKVALVTIDTYRIGAVEQLKSYGEIIGIPLEVTMSPEELQQAVIRHNDKDFILIDTVGHPSGNTAKVIELKEFLEVIKEPKEVFLVLSSTTKRCDLFKIADDFKKAGFNKLIFTKIDETQNLGCILNIVNYLQMPVAYITDGQNVPDDIDWAYPKKLAKLILKGIE